MINKQKLIQYCLYDCKKKKKKEYNFDILIVLRNEFFDLIIR